MATLPRIQYNELGVKSDGCVHQVGYFLDARHDRIAEVASVLDDEPLAHDICHLIRWRRAHQGQPLAEVLPLGC